ncbi:condensation domain-containing protein [Streptomyces tubbatahanensis]|uniref:Condensation domain-containing protein n=1 Tax=Streptomyces tubbatahanensis TaxID=2923272 RepID=A0ABY3XKX3_9ACTN|nr:condensation domain-containing protein [Streptomyces tubbatahanensis]UNS95060.1 condensation domain-containing protein [Streptomyces tubbatahanensis]
MTAADTPVARTAPATFGQRGQWYEQMAAPLARRHLFNLCQSWELRTPRDRPTVRAALAELVRRHEGLRTTLVEDVSGALVQRVHEVGPLDIPADTVADPGTPMLRHPLVGRVARTPFDLRRELPVRFGLLCGDNGFVRLVLCVVNHSASDAFAHALLRKEFHDLLGTSPHLWAGQDGSRAQPCDIAASEHSPLGRRRHQRTLDHLRGKLREVPVSSGPAPGAEGITGKKSRTIARLDLHSAALRTASRWLRGAERISLGALVLAPFSSLLAAYTGEESVPFKVMVTNRFEQGTGASMACMCQPGLTVLRGSSAETVLEAARRCQHELLTAYHHGKYDIKAVERMLAEATAERGPVRLERLFDCLDKDPGDVPETAPSASELEPLASEVTCSGTFQAHGTEMTLRVRGHGSEVLLTLLTDVDVLPEHAAQRVLRGVESAAVRSCLGPPPTVAALAAGLALTPAAGSGPART